eukprot:3339828-Pleurochrysis_carterae.AAC.1
MAAPWRAARRTQPALRCWATLAAQRVFRRKLARNALTRWRETLLEIGMRRWRRSAVSSRTVDEVRMQALAHWGTVRQGAAFYMMRFFAKRQRRISERTSQAASLWCRSALRRALRE